MSRARLSLHSAVGRLDSLARSHSSKALPLYKQLKRRGDDIDSQLSAELLSILTALESLPVQTDCDKLKARLARRWRMSVPDVDAAFENTESFHFLKHLCNIAKLLPSYEEARPRLEESRRARSEAGISTEQKARWMPADAKKVLEQLRRAAAEKNRGGDGQDDQVEPRHGNYEQAVSHDGDNLADDSASSIEYPRRWADDEGGPSPDFSELNWDDAPNPTVSSPRTPPRAIPPGNDPHITTSALSSPSFVAPAPELSTAPAPPIRSPHLNIRIRASRLSGSVHPLAAAEQEHQAAGVSQPNTPVKRKMPEPGEKSQAAKRRSVVVDGGKDETEPGMPTAEEKLNATASLRPGRKVNDAAINYILAFLSAPFAGWEAVNSLNLKPGCVSAFPPYRADSVLLPLNLDNSHWVLLVCTRSAKTLELYDPLPSAGSTLPQAIIVMRRRFSYDVDVLTRFCPKQPNLVDCGIFVLASAFYVVLGMPLPNIIDADAWRHALTCLINGHFPPPEPSAISKRTVVNFVAANQSPTDLYNALADARDVVTEQANRCSTAQTWRELALLHSLLRAALGRVDDLGVQEGELHNDAEQLRKIEQALSHITLARRGRMGWADGGLADNLQETAAELRQAKRRRVVLKELAGNIEGWGAMIGRASKDAARAVQSVMERAEEAAARL